MSEKLHKYFLLEQCSYIYNGDILKVREVFNILDNFAEKFKNNHNYKLLLIEYYNIYLFMATEYASGIDILKIIFENINNNKYKITFNDLDDSYQNFYEINDYIDTYSRKI